MAETLSIPGYNILRELGRGGMASVYLANQHSFDREVALKVMSPLLNSDPSFATRFLREARIVAHIHHSSIVPVFDVGHTEPYHYMSMEFLPAGDLKGRIVGGGFGPKLAYGVCLTIASALDLAHRKGFVHRDIKPENILFREDGTAVLTDFGIARAIAANTSLTVAGTFVGTPSYMSPEQVKGLELDGRSDLYSLGVVFYEMLTGDVPFHADSGFSIAMKQLSDPLPKLPQALAIYQPFLDKMTAKDREARYATGAEVRTALRAIGELAVSREEINLGKAPTHPEETLLRPSSAPREPVIAAAEPQLEAVRTQPARQAKSFRGLVIWLATLVALVVGVVVWRSMPQPEPVAVAPVEPLPEPELFVEAAPGPSEAELRVEAAAASRRAVELKQQQELQKVERDQQIAQLLAAAKERLAAGAFVDPPGANAAESYRAVLRLQPKDPDATTGMKRLGDILAAEAVQSKASGDTVALKKYIEQLQGIQPQHALLDLLRRELKRLEDKPMVLLSSTQSNLEKAAKWVAGANEDLNQKSIDFDAAESATEQYDKASKLAPFAPGLPMLKERIVAAYAAAAQTELNKNDPKRAQKMVAYARGRQWTSPELEQVEAAILQRLDPSSTQNPGGPRRP